MTEQQAVVFDIDNVLVGWNPELLYRKLIHSNADRARFLSEICSPAWVKTIDGGIPISAAVTSRAAAHPEHAELIKAWWVRWPEMFRPAFENCVHLFRGLKERGTPVYALGNFGRESLDLAQTLYPFLSDFDEIVISGDEGVLKPDPKIYKTLESRTGADPQSLFFIDDEEDNLAAAAERGWRTHHFMGEDELARALMDADLLDPTDLPREI